MKLSDYTCAVRYKDVAWTTDDNHHSIKQDIVFKFFLTPQQRRDEQRWDIINGWLDENWDQFHMDIEEGFVHRPTGEFLDREQMWNLLPHKAKIAAIENDAGRNWADAADLYECAA